MCFNKLVLLDDLNLMDYISVNVLFIMTIHLR